MLLAVTILQKIIRMTNSKSKIAHVPMRVGEALNTKIIAKTHKNYSSN